MKKINVYGTGCHNCNETMAIIDKVAQQLGIEVQLTKITDLEKIMLAGVMSTPGIAVDGVLKHSGSVPDEALIKTILQA